MLTFTSFMILTVHYTLAFFLSASVAVVRNDDGLHLSPATSLERLFDRRFTGIAFPEPF